MNLKSRVASVAILMLAVLTGCTPVSAAPAPSTPAATSVTASVAPSTHSAAPSATVSVSPSATTKPSASASGATSPTAKPTPTSSPTAEFTPAWGPTEDCSGATPIPKYAAQCRVKGKSQAQVWQACLAAAQGSLWEKSSAAHGADKAWGVKDPNLTEDMRVCGNGSGVGPAKGLETDDMLYVFGYPYAANEGDKHPRSALQYFLIRGTTHPGGDIVAFMFYADGKNTGYPASDDLADMIADLYASMSHGV